MPRSTRKKMSYAKMLKRITAPVKALYPTLVYSSKLNPKAKTFKPKRKLDIRQMTSLLKPGIKQLNPLVKSFSLKKKTAKHSKKVRRHKKSRNHKKTRHHKKSRNHKKTRHRKK